MTAKEAATGSWTWLKHYRWAVGCVAAGGCMAWVGLSFDDLAKLQASGAASAIWGAILWLVERSAKRTGNEVSQKIETVAPVVADKVADRIWEQLGSVQSVVNESSRAIMQLSNQVSQTERTRATDHQQNTKQHEEGQAKTDRLGEELQGVKADVKDLQGKFTRHDAEIDVLKRLIPEGLHKAQ